MEPTPARLTVPATAPPPNVAVAGLLGGRTVGREDVSVVHVLERLAIVEARVRAEVGRLSAAMAADGPDSDEAFRGLFISEQQADALLAAGPPMPVAYDQDTVDRLALVERQADRFVEAGARLRLRELADRFDLADMDVEVLLVAAAPDLDPRFEQLYGYLNNNVGQPRATIGLALRLCGVSLTSGRARARLSARGPLVSAGLVHIENVERPVLTRSLRVADRVLAHLLGDDEVAPMLRDVLGTSVVTATASSYRLARALAEGMRCAYVRDEPGTDGRALAVSALHARARDVLNLDVERFAAVDDVDAVVRAAIREARLGGLGLVVGPIDELIEQEPVSVQALATAEVPVVLFGTRPWDPRWSSVVPVVIEADRVDADTLGEVWHDALGDAAAPGLDPVAATAHLRMTPSQVARAAQAARGHAASEGRAVRAEDLQLGVRSQNSTGLQRLARRFEPRVGWDDLVLPDPVMDDLRELVARWRHRDQVLDDWRLGRAASHGRGVSALFAGESGTGKTLASEVIAAALNLDLYVIDLSTVIDKYIGETSKNLDRIFSEAHRVNGVLLFDEADALFGKRSAVSDAKDRHANVEVAFLLQRMESFDGVVILTTNLASNLDVAFMRRLDAIIDFPRPDVALRRALWAAKLPAELPLGDGIDVELLASSFELSGSEIHSIVVSAAYRASIRAEPVTMRELVRATVREHRKLGRHLSPGDLGPFAAWLGSEF